VNAGAIVYDGGKGRNARGLASDELNPGDADQDYENRKSDCGKDEGAVAHGALAKDRYNQSAASASAMRRGS
jgi:hypothetical protein